MFCPKCGTQNLGNGKFCRSCGTDLAGVSDALAAKRAGQPSSFNMIEPLQPAQLLCAKGKPLSWEKAMVKLFTGLAFLIISMILGISQMGRGWWFWLLIPAFSLVGGGIAQIIQLRKGAANLTLSSRFQAAGNDNQQLNQVDFNRVEEFLNSGRKIEAIGFFREVTGFDLKDAKEAVEQIESNRIRRSYSPQTANRYVNPQQSIYETGEFAVAPSVTEGTTRHLEINNEGETMTLPENDYRQTNNKN